MASVRSHENIELMTYSEVAEVSGYVGNFKVKIRQKPRYVDITKCTGCGTCQDKCPMKADNEFDCGLGKRKVIYTPFPQAVPNVPVIDATRCTFLLKGKCGACKKFCEAGAIDFEQKEKIVEVNPFCTKAQAGDLIELINHLAVDGKVAVWTYEKDPVTRCQR